MAKKQTFKPADFVHLHNHTHYSVLDGLQKVPEMLDYVKKLGMNSIAITDHGTMSGAIEFYKEAKDRGIKPIIGMETYVASRRHTDKDPAKDKGRYHLTLLAMNNIGYENLMRLSSIANLEGFYHKPRIDHNLLERYHEGLIVLSGCIGGEVGESLRADQDEQAKKTAEWYKQIFGDRYYLEIQDHEHQWDEQKHINDKIKALGKTLDIPLVLTSDAHYLRHEDQEAHEILLCVQTGSFYSDEDRMTLADMDLYVTDPKEIVERWSETPEVLENARKIADRCDVTVELGRFLIPQFAVPKNMSEESYLKKLTYQGLAARYTDTTEEAAHKLSVSAAKKMLPKEIIERAEFELGVITRMGFPGYFLIVQDFINWGKDREIVFGPGRGSGASSIVAYALNITDLEPLRYGLLFERFLNPDRISMPDFDIDIQDNRRDEVIEYVLEKYGEERVAHIVTFGKMAARNAIRDVARVLEMSYADADRLAKMVPPPVQGRHIPLETSLKNEALLREEYETSPESKRVIDLAMRLEGTIRSHGVHAAGVVIAPDDLIKFVPLEMAQKGVVTTQYPMVPIEELGLLKMDFLGLSNLTIIKNALRIIRKVDNKEIDISSIPLDDPKTYALLGRGETTGVFQLESSGMKRYIRALKPDSFEDLIAMVALYRPGPLTAGYVDRFISRKNGAEQVSYDHDSMKIALEPTYGVLIYQEQVMRIAQDMCGFSGGQADTLRKAIGKKKRDVMAKMKKEFVDGAQKTAGVSRQFADKFWKELEGFADYAFPKAHAACYAMIAYQTAYLKAHYPAAFMAALMTSDYDNTDRLAIEIAECQHMSIDVLPPDVNESFLEFAVVPETNQIRFGMAAIKNVGTGAVEEILRARDEAGKFASVEDFAQRVSTRIVNRKTWESLIKAGAFDRFGGRSDLIFNLDTILAYGAKMQKEAESGQTDLFGNSALADSINPTLALETAPADVSEREMLQWERDLLGLYLSRHPLEPYRVYFEEQTVPVNNITTSMDNRSVEVGGIVNAIRSITTKNGSKMAFVAIEDLTGEVELIVFPNTYQAHEDILRRDTVLRAKGKISTKDREGRTSEEIKIIVDELNELTPAEIEQYQPNGTSKKPPTTSKATAQATPSVSVPAPSLASQKLYIHVKNPDDTERLKQLKALLNESPGQTETVLVLGVDKDKSAIRLPFGIDVSDELTAAIAGIFEPAAVVLK